MTQTHNLYKQNCKITAVKTLTYAAQLLYAKVKNLCLVFSFSIIGKLGVLSKLLSEVFSILKFSIPNHCNECCGFHR